MKKYVLTGILLLLLLALMTGCGKEKTAAEDGSNIVPKVTDGTEAEQGNGQNYEVLLDEREEEARYWYGMEDLSFVDTVSGKKISVGMARAEIEAITGTPIETRNKNVTYDGVLVQYTAEDRAGSLVVSGGQFREEPQATRYRTVRGVGLFTDFADFVKAYGDQHYQGKPVEAEEEIPTEAPSNAVRYFKVEGEKVVYLGDTIPQEETGKEENLYMQDFIFSRSEKKVTAMRVTRWDMIGR